MAKTKARVTSTHHVAVRFDCPISVIWDDILLGLGSGRQFEEQGYRMAPLGDDPRAYLGGYRMWREETDDPDERLVYISECDDIARRLSLCAYYLGAKARGTVVHATYSAARNNIGHWYQIDCHGTYDLEIDEHSSAADVAAIMIKSKEEMDRYLTASLEVRKQYLEAEHTKKQAY